MIGLAKVVAVIGALLATRLLMSLIPLVRTVIMGTTTVRLKTGTTVTTYTALRVLLLVPGVLVFSLPVVFSG